jgi:hypothetical protein
LDALWTDGSLAAGRSLCPVCSLAAGGPLRSRCAGGSGDSLRALRTAGALCACRPGRTRRALGPVAARSAGRTSRSGSSWGSAGALGSGRSRRTSRSCSSSGPGGALRSARALRSNLAQRTGRAGQPGGTRCALRTLSPLDTEAIELQRRYIALIANRRLEPIYTPSLRTRAQVKRLNAPLESLWPEGQAGRSGSGGLDREGAHPRGCSRRLSVAQYPCHCDSGEAGLANPPAANILPLLGPPPLPRIRSKAPLPIRQWHSCRGTLKVLAEALPPVAFAYLHNSDPRERGVPRSLPST